MTNNMHGYTLYSIGSHSNAPFTEKQKIVLPPFQNSPLRLWHTN